MGAASVYDGFYFLLAPHFWHYYLGFDSKVNGRLASLTWVVITAVHFSGAWRGFPGWGSLDFIGKEWNLHSLLGDFPFIGWSAWSVARVWPWGTWAGAKHSEARCPF